MRKLSVETVQEREVYRCAACGRFTPRDTEPYYDRENREDESSVVLPFCSEAHAERYHVRRVKP